MAGTPVVATEIQWRRQTEKRLGWLERRPSGSDVISTANSQAEVDALVAQWNPTTARPLVIIRNDRRPSELVVTTDGVMWQETKPQHAPFKPATLSTITNFGSAHHKISYMKTSEGIVVLSGLTGAFASGTIFTLPAGHRPGEKWMFPILAGGGAGRIDVNTDGTVVLSAGSSYNSLECIMFPAAGVATWTNIGSGGSTFSGTWASYHTIDPAWPVAGFWRDPLGRVWIRGLFRQTTPTTLGGNSQVCILPFRKNLISHYPALSVGAFATFLSAPLTGSTCEVVAQSGTNTNWTCPARGMFPDMNVADTWLQNDLYANSWGKYPSAAYAPSRLMICRDGIVIADGLTSAGAVGTGIPTSYEQMLVEGQLPDVRYGQNNFISGKMVMLAAANLAVGRTDYVGYNLDNAPYLVQAVAGSNVWRSRGGLNYVLGG